MPVKTAAAPTKKKVVSYSKDDKIKAAHVLGICDKCFSKKKRVVKGTSRCRSCQPKMVGRTPKYEGMNCKWPTCKRGAQVRGYCTSHYASLRKTFVPRGE